MNAGLMVTSVSAGNPSMAFWRLVLVSVLVALAAGSLLVTAGCASSNANRASRDAAATLRFGDLQSTAEQLADNILASPRFERARADAIGRGEEVVVALMEPVTIEGDDYTGDLRRKVDEFFDVVPEVFLQRDIGEFRRVKVAGGQYQESVQEGRLDAFDFQDVGAKFDQSTGVVSTQGKAKAVFAMEAIGKRDRIPNGSRNAYEFVLRIKLFDVVRKTTIYSGSVVLSK